MNFFNVDIIPKGTVFVVTHCEYSEYKIVDVCEALVDLNVEALKKEYLSEYPEYKDVGDFEGHMATTWMIEEKHYAKKIEYVELWLGNYCEFAFDCSRKEEE